MLNFMANDCMCLPVIIAKPWDCAVTFSLHLSVLKLKILTVYHLILHIWIRIIKHLSNCYLVYIVLLSMFHCQIPEVMTTGLLK